MVRRALRVSVGYLYTTGDPEQAELARKILESL